MSTIVAFQKGKKWIKEYLCKLLFYNNSLDKNSHKMLNPLSTLMRGLHIYTHMCRDIHGLIKKYWNCHYGNGAKGNRMKPLGKD